MQFIILLEKLGGGGGGVVGKVRINYTPVLYYQHQKQNVILPNSPLSNIISESI